MQQWPGSWQANPAKQIARRAGRLVFACSLSKDHCPNQATLFPCILLMMSPLLATGIRRWEGRVISSLQLFRNLVTCPADCAAFWLLDDFYAAARSADVFYAVLGTVATLSQK